MRSRHLGTPPVRGAGATHTDDNGAFHGNFSAWTTLIMEEERYYDEIAVWLRKETGYSTIQGTKPQTLAFGLTNSPAGLAA